MGIFGKVFGNATPASQSIAQASDAKTEHRRYVADILDNQEMQTPESLRNTPPVDRLPGGRGEFGFDEQNPIPVNGPIGPLAYLSRLETQSGEKLVFHRLGAIKQIHAFEAVTWSGSEWYIFFMDIAHSRRSIIAPSGFTLSPRPNRFSGFSIYCDKFPYDFPFAMVSDAKDPPIVEGYFSFGNIINQIREHRFERSLAHKLKVDLITAKLTDVPYSYSPYKTPPKTDSRIYNALGREILFDDERQAILAKKIQAFTGTWLSIEECVTCGIAVRAKLLAGAAAGWLSGEKETNIVNMLLNTHSRHMDRSMARELCILIERESAEVLYPWMDEFYPKDTSTVFLKKSDLEKRWLLVRGTETLAISGATLQALFDLAASNGWVGARDLFSPDGTQITIRPSVVSTIDATELANKLRLKLESILVKMDAKTTKPFTEAMAFISQGGFTIQ